MKKVSYHFLIAIVIFLLASCNERGDVKPAGRIPSSRGGIVVFGKADCVRAVSDYMLSCDDFDNVSGRAVSDSLPDFAGEVILKVNLDPSVSTDSLSLLIPEGKYFIEARDTSFLSVRAQVVQCYRVLRFRNAFTHRIAYPQSESYVLLHNTDGKAVIRKADGVDSI